MQFTLVQYWQEWKQVMKETLPAWDYVLQFGEWMQQLVWEAGGVG